MSLQLKRGYTIDINTINSDIDFTLDMPVGSYFSLLYNKEEEMAEVLLSFLDAGFKNNECCVLGFSDEKGHKLALNILREAGIDVDTHLKTGQIILISCDECYVDDQVAEREAQHWEALYDESISAGFTGLRMFNKFSIIGDDAWDSFVEFEQMGMWVIEKKGIISIFAFLEEARSRSEIIELIGMHDGTIVKKRDTWTFLQSSSYCKTVQKEVCFPNDILENVWTGVWAIDKHDTIIYFNKGMESLSGLLSKDVLGKKIISLMPRQLEGDELSFIDIFHMTKQSLHSRNYDIFPFIKPDGQYIYHSGVLFPLRDDHGDYAGMLGTVGNTIEQNIEHKELKGEFLSAERLGDIYKKSPVVAFLWAAKEDWPIEFVSENISQFGYIPEELTSGNFVYSDMIHPDDLDFVSNDVAQLEISGKMYFSREYRLLTKSGNSKWVTERSFLIRDQDGNPAYYQGIIIDITERKKAEDALIAAEKKYRMIFENSPLGIFNFDENGVITHCNDKFLNIIGLESKENIIGFSMVESVSNPDMKKAIDNVLSRKPGHFEGQYRTIKSGRKVYVKADYSPNIADDGTFIGGIGIFEDISERKKAEQAVINAEKKYRLIFENSPIGIFNFDKNGVVSHCNRKFLEIMGMQTYEEAIGFNMISLVQDEQMKKAIDNALSRKTGHFEGEYHTVKTGKNVNLKADFSPNISDDGTFLGGIGIFEDISERKKAEDALRLDESRLEALLKLNQMTSMSFKEIANFVQEEAVRMTQSKIGYLAFLDEENVLAMHSWSKSAMSICAVEDRRFDYPLATTGIWGEPVRQRIPIITNDFQAPNPLKKGYPLGHIKILRHMNIPIFDGDEIVGVAGVGNKETDYDQSDVRQLTLLMEGMWRLIQRKKAEDTLREYAQELSSVNDELSKANDELSQANDELKSLDRMKDEFLSNVSHEFKTPLTSIQGYSELISDGTLGDVNEQQKKAVMTVIRNSERLRRLVDSLLYLSRAQAGKIHYSFDTVQITEVINNSIQDVALQAESKNIKIEKNLPDKLPVFTADKDKLMDVFINLLDNAVKFTPEGGSITISSNVEEKSLHVFVRDTGIGIPKDKIPNLFQRFYQVDASGKRKYGGTGLGLYICKKIVEDHAGNIWAESTEGQGSTFHILLPI